MSGKYNAEGYRDNTAYEALHNVSRHHIHYTRGVMDINLSAFFPCQQEVAKALLSLVANYCPLDDQIRFQSFLTTKAKMMQGRILRLEALPNHTDYHRRELSQLRRMYRLLSQNIALFKSMEVTS